MIRILGGKEHVLAPMNGGVKPTMSLKGENFTINNLCRGSFGPRCIVASLHGVSQYVFGEIASVLKVGWSKTAWCIFPRSIGALYERQWRRVMAGRAFAILSIALQKTRSEAWV